MVLFKTAILLSSLCICKSQTVSRFEDKYEREDFYNLKVGFLAPWDSTDEDVSAYTSASAFTMALEEIHRNPALNNTINITYVSYDSGCDSKRAAGNAVRMVVDHKVDAFIGPPCSIACRSVAELASFWNIPVLSWLSTDPDFLDKVTFSTLARLLGPFYKMGLFLVDFLVEFNWQSVVVMSSRNGMWLDASRSIRKSFDENNITIAYEPTFKPNPSNRIMEDMLLKSKNRGRIIILIAPRTDRRRIMLKARELEMTSGDYVFITLEMMPTDRALRENEIWQRNDDLDPLARDAFESVFMITLSSMDSSEVIDFRSEVAKRMYQPPWDEYMKGYKGPPFEYGDKYSPFVYDTIMTYAYAVNHTIFTGKNPRNGNHVLDSITKTAFRGMSGAVVMDMNAEREPNYWVSDMQKDGSFELMLAQVIDLETGKKRMIEYLPPIWPSGRIGRKYTPPDTPKCGFRGDLCPKENPLWITVAVVISVLVVLSSASGIGTYLYRRVRHEANLQQQNWKVVYEDIEPLKVGAKRLGSTPSMGSVNSASQDGSNNYLSNADSKLSSMSRSIPSVCTGTGQMFTDIGLYRGNVIAIKHIKKQHVQVTRNVLREFAEVQELKHDNLNTFVGACVEHPHISLIWKYCSKGSLQDVLGDDNIKMDNTFKYSFMMDIAKGMSYLHNSQITSHGNLKSSNCLVDGRWTVKITDYGLSTFLSGQTLPETEEEIYKKKLWTAPEILRENIPPPKGTQKGDVYSYAIVSYEIMMRTEPFTFETNTPKDVINRIRNGESIPYRPKFPANTNGEPKLMELIRSCWDEKEDLRPTFMALRSSLKRITGEINILDTILLMMEKFANNLEELVEERTQQLVEEQKKTDRLLYRMLPSSVAESLKTGNFVKPESYDQATIYFSDIVDFQGLAQDSNPMQIVDFLNELYSCFDDVIARHDVYKVETIGDAYMCVSGVPVQNGSRHSQEIANCALDLLSEVAHFRIKHRPHHQLQLRVGLHKGPVVAGVVGSVMPRYCLFGDTVNMAARMQSTGKALRIHISKNVYNALNEIGDYQMALRGEMNVKGKGIQMTYFLYGKKGFQKPLPTFDINEIAREGMKKT